MLEERKSFLSLQEVPVLLLQKKNSVVYHFDKLHYLYDRNRRVSSPLSPIFPLFLAPSGTLYLKVQQLLAHDEAPDASPPAMGGKRRPGPKHPQYGIPADHWPLVIHRVVENTEPLRPVAKEYGVSSETIRHLLLHALEHQRQHEA